MKVRGLVRVAGWIFILWGGLVAFIGLFHAFFGEPEANYYSLHKWEFVTQEQWLRWSGFEMTYGLACAAVGLVLWEFAKHLPEWVVRAKEPSDRLL